MKFDKFTNPEKIPERKKSQKQEIKIAKEIKGKPTINSGAFLISDKADVKKENVRIECKRTDKQQIIIKKEWLEKLRNDCTYKDIPVFNIEIQDENWYMVRAEEFEYIMQMIKKYAKF
jgi:hypothetical protein